MVKLRENDSVAEIPEDKKTWTRVLAAQMTREGYNSKATQKKSNLNYQQTVLECVFLHDISSKLTLLELNTIT